MTTTMVTGGLGFVGRHVVTALREAGDNVVSYNRDFSESPDTGVAAVQGELYDVPRLVATMRRHGVDRIVHTAAMSHPELSIELPITTFEANVNGTTHLFEAARMTGVQRVVNFSSECAYGHHEDPIDEDAPLRPTTPYGVTKVTTELLGRVYTDLYGLDVVSLRVTQVYGPGNRMPETLKELLQAALAGRPLSLERGGDHRFHLVHVEDVAAAAVAAVARGAGHAGVYNVTGGNQVTLHELAQLVRTRFPDARLEIGDGHIATLDRQGPYDISAAQRDLGYIPRWSLGAGIDAYAAWLRDHPH
ncbi:MAG: UDP-glucose 4-epimerase [Solirubrobacteraceae bacterium]|jgi:UDP-glucose 4-epimerase|nr:UDP-glucose 4-epimerase [Solirubrobacteraceae bacterium]